MQRAQSAVDFSNLLNPDSASAKTNNASTGGDSMIRQQFAQRQDAGSVDVEMASAGTSMALRPNGPLPTSGQPTTEPTNEMPRPYKCPLCDKAFHRLEHQTRHIRTHTGEKPHACQFPGCSKRFSRSDELTRHSRIHNNPNSRRHNKATHIPHASYNPNGDNLMPPPPGPKTIRSAPPSTLGSPNHSPPHSYSSYSLSSGLKPPYGSGSSGTSSVPSGGRMSTGGLGGFGASAFGNTSPQQSHQGMDINMLAKAAHQVERETLMGPPSHFSSPSRHSHTNLHHHHHSSLHHTSPPSSFYGNSVQSSRGHLPSLSAYHMSRSNSHEDHAANNSNNGNANNSGNNSNSNNSSGNNSDEHYSHHYRMPKRSRPNSPNSTAPSSPTFSHDSLSPTPDPHTSRHACAFASSETVFEHIRVAPFPSTVAPVHTTPALAPLEPQPDSSKYTQPNAMGGVMRSSSGMSLSDILSRPDGSQRKLPVPQVMTKVVSQDLLMPSDGFNLSGRSSSSNSISGGDLMDRV